MRTIAPALLLIVASCGQGDRGANQSQAPARNSPSEPQAIAVPTITIAATGPGGCSASWDGQPVTPAQITERSIALLERAIAAVGGAQNATETTFPTPTVEAPADLSFACADTVLFALQRAGMINVRLRPAGGQPSVLADFPQDTEAPPQPVPMALGIGGGGQLTWNNAPVDAAQLAAQLGRIGGPVSDLNPVQEVPPPGGLEVLVTREATFGQLCELLQTVRRYNLRPFLYLPSALAAAADPAPAAPPPR